MAQNEDTRYMITEVADRLNLSPSAVRKKERQGEFPPPRRDERNWRFYTEEDILKLQAYFVGRGSGKRRSKMRA